MIIIAMNERVWMNDIDISFVLLLFLIVIIAIEANAPSVIYRAKHARDPEGISASPAREAGN